MKLALIALPVLALSLAGCGAIGAIGFPLNGQEQTAAPPATPSGPPQNLSPAIEPGVVATPLPPANDFSGPVAPGTPLQPVDPLATPPAQPPQVAQAPAVGSQQAVGRTDLLGGWTVTSGSDTCELFMTLTAWTGGYRASTRGCASTTLSQISAWNLEGSQVTLGSGDGTTIARLSPAGEGRFNGTLVDGTTAITFFR